jgi:nucleoid DNA-binding protein
MKPGDSRQTYHVRHKQRHVVTTEELRAHMASHTLLSEGLFELAIKTLRDELVEQLLDGNGVHIEGLGFFSLELGTVKVRDEQGRLRPKTYTSEEQLPTRDVVVEGINFAPDREMLSLLLSKECRFERLKYYTADEIPRDELLQTLADHCSQHGEFTRGDFQRLFHVTRYRADQILAALVGEERPQYCREKRGASWVYRKTDT